MINKNQNKRTNGKMFNKPEKRFSKAKMKRETVNEQNKETVQKELKETPKRSFQYSNAAAVRYEFRGVAKKIYTATLAGRSSQQHGYHILSKGQLVTVEDFGGDQPLRITSLDGRQGICSEACIKPLRFS